MSADDEAPDSAQPDGEPVEVVVSMPLGGPPTWPQREDVEDDYPVMAMTEFRAALDTVGGDWTKVGAELLRIRSANAERAQADLPPWHPDRLR